MKLLYCRDCGDIFNLTGTRVKECHCGKVKGVYISPSEAITNGNGHSLAIGNGSFEKALIRKMVTESKGYDRKYYQTDCKVEYVWFRPNEGDGNPHTFIVGEGHEGWKDEK